MDIELIRQKKFGKGFSISVILSAFLLIIYGGMNVGRASVDQLILGMFPLLTFIITAIAILNDDQIPIREGLFIKAFKPKYLLYAIMFFAGLFFSFGFINVLFSNALVSIHFQPTAEELVINNFGDYINYVIALALAPAVGEEVLFRGLILYCFLHFAVKNEDKTDGRTDLKISLVIGLIFAVYHKNLAQLIYQFACGFCFTLLAIKSRSIFPSILAHFLNNFIIVTCYYISPTLNILGWWQMIIGFIVLAVTVYLILFSKGERKPFSDENGEVFNPSFFMKKSVYGIAFCLIMLVFTIGSTLISAYV